jgi:predicted metalloendopeptidase
MQITSLFTIATSLLLVNAAPPPLTGNYVERLLSYADFSVDPCDDFYTFSCGGFDKTHPATPQTGTQSNFDLVTERNKQFIIDYFINFKGTDGIDTSLKQVYDACMQGNKDSSEKALSSILNLIDSNDFSTVQGRTNIMTEFFKHSSSSIIGLGIFPAFDREDKLNDWTLVQPIDLRLGKKEDYTEANLAVLTESHSKLVKKVPSLSIKPEDVRALVDFENEIAKMTTPWSELLFQMNHSKRLTLDDLSKLLPDFVDWKALFANVTNGQVPDSVVVMNEPYFQKLAELLRKTDANTVKKYLKLSFVADLAKYLHVEEGAPSKEVKKNKKEEECALLTEKVFRVMVTHKFISTHVPLKKKQKVVEIVDAVRKSAEKLISKTPWVQQSTRTAALEKLKALDSSQIAYPDFYLDANEVMKYYEGLKITDNIAEIGLEKVKYDFRKTVSGVGKKEDPNQWGLLIDISEVNASYVSYALFFYITCKGKVLT